MVHALITPQIQQKVQMNSNLDNLFNFMTKLKFLLNVTIFKLLIQNLYLLHHELEQINI